jgi:hypothetical protein
LSFCETAYGNNNNYDLRGIVANVETNAFCEQIAFGIDDPVATTAVIDSLAESSIEIAVAQ